ncbi:MAG: DUF853 domain-containing protein [Lachnospiraceae bacterium]|nr:DUF853 domain-containing protein [Lachnospiraceae bacterium]
MICDGKILIGKVKEKDADVCIYPSMANRHGLIAGATGTGKTVTLRTLAESFSMMGVPVFMADAKGDLASMVDAGDAAGTKDRAGNMGLYEKGFSYCGFPVCFWDVYGQTGLPLRTTVSEMGPVLLSRIMDLNDTQSDILNIIFKIADDEGLLLIDLKDLKSMVAFVGENAKEYSSSYGNIAAASINAITRAIVSIQSEGAESFFGEPALNISDWLLPDASGKGMIELLDCRKLMLSPRMYSMFMLWLMSELFETLPEVGDLDKPRMVFFFDEAHMLFDGAPKVLLEKIEQVVKLIRSKGVGIYFITQNPKDIPDGILAQLGNKIQHALRAYTPAEMKGVKAAAQSFRENPEFDTMKALGELATGEALVSVLDEKGVPTIVERTMIVPPSSRLGTLDDVKRDEITKRSMLYPRYNDFFDRDSAYEFLERHKQEVAAAQAAETVQASDSTVYRGTAPVPSAQVTGNSLLEAQERARLEKEALKAKNQRNKAVSRATTSVAKTVTGTIGRELGNSVGRSLFGSGFGKRLGGNVGASIGRNLIGIFTGR